MARYIKKKRAFAPTIYDAWVTKAFDLNPGEQLFIPVEDKPEQKLIYSVMTDALERGPRSLRTEIRVAKTFRDKRLWVQLTRRRMDHATAFIKYQKEDGSWDVKRTDLETDAERLRTIQVMVEDGYTQEEVEKEIGQLSEAEELLFYKGGF